MNKHIDITYLTYSILFSIGYAPWNIPYRRDIPIRSEQDKENDAYKSLFEAMTLLDDKPIELKARKAFTPNGYIET